ncbi:hypothetical protein Swit_5322 (plasmid) [Rhizorhabdus wittichii RW1]|jgi:hypothetical protein|uniref:Uncharacterized protein n=1 Tax=Rhizorhabdus wittichii (strain DSM 6014 / CCUG 31198 / JCM 15750 / NBRC 105917 / EY 4224 / RW1) TaxID=392499 RepID=A0A9J9HGK5_RHIWR|nr:hypothetical protein Swit_5322 [Rhizorhabdus wittichii RW1]
MFDWLKQQLRGAPSAKVVKLPGQTEKAALVISDDEIRAAFRQATLNHLADVHGLKPVYCSDLQSEKAFEAAQADMPLIAVWNEHQRPDGLAFSLSVNMLLVKAALLEYMEELDPWFDEECARIAADLKDLTYNTIVQTATETGWTPSAICTALADKPNA